MEVSLQQELLKISSSDSQNNFYKLRVVEYMLVQQPACLYGILPALQNQSRTSHPLQKSRRILVTSTLRFYAIPWTDVVEIIPAQKTSFSTSGNPIPGNEHDNLCMKAYHLLKKISTLPEVAVHLHKVIPTGAGTWRRIF